ncbi:RagB/SusD family nutrient uptake outer membrane protein [Niabella sp. 22666]|uniref:RagB/SusD family nutrient uptake outer membrane protein n=1 Tax=Niabella sp. 22666 TaxID=3453954 RepID=UPI003F841C62
MKKIAFYIISILLLSGCSKVLDYPNLSRYEPDLVWNDPNLANAYLGNIYDRAFGNWNIGLDAQSEQLTGISFSVPVTTTNPGALSIDWGTNYTQIRLINQGIISTNSGALSQDVKNRLLGQLYFLRAYAYFGLVKTYGGVPYIKIPQDRDTDSLNVPRNSTRECFEFMVADLDSAIGLLPRRVVASSADWGRIDGNFAHAFKAKVLLYKASPQFNPSNPWNNNFWADAYTQNKKAYDSLKAQGYALIGDYAQIALSERNAEVVFSVTNLFPNKVAAWDNGARPGSLSRGPASTTPTWEMVKSFPMKDGKKYNDVSGKYYTADTLQAYWLNRDPRFEKSVVWNAKLYPAAGTTSGYRQYTSVGVADALDSYGINPKSSTTSQNNNRYSGFFILKNSNLSLTQAQVQQYDVDYVVMRFAEVMLNYAEAANETAHTDDALAILKQIRQRAGIEPGADGSYGITATTREQVRQAIMDERNVELCFEGHRFNDLRRWRLFSLLHGKNKTGVEAIAINADKTEMPLTTARQMALNNQLTESNFVYRLQVTPQTGVTVNTLPETYYFAPIQQSVIAAANKIEQNKEWGGTFDPTIH